MQMVKMRAMIIAIRCFVILAICFVGTGCKQSVYKEPPDYESNLDWTVSNVMHIARIDTGVEVGYYLFPMPSRQVLVEEIRRDAIRANSVEELTYYWAALSGDMIGLYSPNSIVADPDNGLVKLSQAEMDKIKFILNLLGKKVSYDSGLGSL